MTDKKRRLVAYHEAGHAVVGALMPEYDPVSQGGWQGRGGRNNSCVSVLMRCPSATARLPRVSVAGSFSCFTN